MWLQHPGLIFKVLRRREPAMIPGTASAQCSNEAPVAESSADDAVFMYDYEISNKTLAGGLIAATRAVGHVPGIGVGDVGWRAGLCHGL
jgi:hypothetical protein